MGSISPGRNSKTYIPDAGGAPSSTFCKAFNSQARYFCVRAPLLPSIDTTRTESKAFVSVQTPGNHGQNAELHGIENLVRITGGANANVGAGRFLLHVGGQGEGRVGVSVEYILGSQSGAGARNRLGINETIFYSGEQILSETCPATEIITKTLLVEMTQKAGRQSR